MLQITPQMKILVAVEPADFRRGIDALVRLCQETLQQDPFVGTVFVFRNRKATSLKVLMYDGQGFWLCQKRLSQGRFPWWPSAGEGTARRLAAHQLFTRNRREWNRQAGLVIEEPACGAPRLPRRPACTH